MIPDIWSLILISVTVYKLQDWICTVQFDTVFIFVIHFDLKATCTVQLFRKQSPWKRSRKNNTSCSNDVSRALAGVCTRSSQSSFASDADFILVLYSVIVCRIFRSCPFVRSHEGGCDWIFALAFIHSKQNSCFFVFVLHFMLFLLCNPSG